MSEVDDAAGAAVLEVERLEKSFATPFTRRRVAALRGVSFRVERGEVFGFLGPNGAGKTTTIRILMGLIKASGGRAAIFGHEVPSREARARLGFLPESPYFYDYLDAGEMLDLVGRLFGLDRATRRKRAARLIDMVGLGDAGSKPLKKYSKGMLQRAGIAQALISDPELVVFDEPMSGLDPVGRREVRDIITTLRDEGKTVFFSSHILADVEEICDRVGIVVRGRMHDVGRVADLVHGKRLGTDVTLTVDGDAGAAIEALARDGADIRHVEGILRVGLDAAIDVDQFLADAREAGARVDTVMPRHETLEDLFIRAATGDERGDREEATA